jgi:hypothetical protein
MIPALRDAFNSRFTDEKYQRLLQLLTSRYQVAPAFRVAESPFFIPALLKDRLLEATQQLAAQITRPDFKSLTQGALYTPSVIVPGEDAHTTFLQMDFAVCLDEDGEPTPQLIEIQGFPSVYFFQYMVADAYREVFDLPPSLTSFFHPGMGPAGYKKMMQDIIVGDEAPEHCVLLEIEPRKQTTYIDMAATSAELGIPVLCVTEVKKQGRLLYYTDSTGRDVVIRRIYNRVIFDELFQRSDLPLAFSFTDDLDVKWVGHPNWFYRISKYLMPLLNSPYVPESYFLGDLTSFPPDLSQYVLKPLFSFSGSGVLVDVTEKDLLALDNPSHYILQKKVVYAPVLRAPGEPVKVEIRMLMLWPDEAPAPFIVNNLVRLSKGKMIGVKYNKDKDWVGGSVGFFS